MVARRARKDGAFVDEPGTEPETACRGLDEQ
jgi:hypothetical protein